MTRVRVSLESEPSTTSVPPDWTVTLLRVVPLATALPPAETMTSPRSFPAEEAMVTFVAIPPEET